MKARALVERAAWLLADAEHARFAQDLLLRFLSDAQRQLALLVPQAVAVSTVLRLTPGTLQAIPADGLRLLDAVRLMGQDGATPGQAVSLVDRSSLDAADPGWHATDPSPLVSHYVFDSRTPKLFYVFPPVPDSPAVHLELHYARIPAELSSMDDELAVPEAYSGPLLDWMLHLAFAMDGEAEAGRARSETRRTAFAQTLAAAAG